MTTAYLTDWTYEEWADNVRPLNGFVGQVFQSDNCAIPEKVLEWFTRYKLENPEKLILIHYNGRSRLPIDGIDGGGKYLFAGFYLHRAGTQLLAPIGPADQTVTVASAETFRLDEGFSGDLGSDVVIAAVDSAGRPDFTQVEQVTVAGIEGNELTIQRGRYGTTARSFAAGAYVAAHVVDGPWAHGCGLEWFYNFSTTGPADPDGRMLYEVLAEQIGDWFGPGGLLEPFDGLELDVFEYGLPPRGAARADCDNDGVADTGVYLGRSETSEFDGLNTVYQGTNLFMANTRAALGPDRFFVVDDFVSRPSFTAVNGVELEGFPIAAGSDLLGWSTALAKLEFWRDHHAGRGLSYTNFKWAPPLTPPDSFAPFRVALAGTLFADGILGQFMNYQGSYDYVTPLVIWDELVKGADQQANWLGRPRGRAIHTGLRTPDLLTGSGRAISDAFLARLTIDNGDLQRIHHHGRPAVQVTPDADVPRSTLHVHDLRIDGPDLLVSFQISADPQPEYGDTVPRQVVTITTNQDATITRTSYGWAPPDDHQHLVIYARGIGPGPVTLTISVEGTTAWTIRAVTAHDAPDTMYRRYQHGLVLANPSETPQPFDLTTITRGRHYRRLSATTGQDSATNNGQRATGTITIPALDALFVTTDPDQHT